MSMSHFMITNITFVRYLCQENMHPLYHIVSSIYNNRTEIRKGWGYLVALSNNGLHQQCFFVSFFLSWVDVVQYSRFSCNTPSLLHPTDRRHGRQAKKTEKRLNRNKNNGLSGRLTAENARRQGASRRHHRGGRCQWR